MSHFAHGGRQGHAVLDLGSRRHKGAKIERLLGLDQRSGAVRLLEIGTGSGGIAHYFGTHPSERFTVDAVDVSDVRLVTDGYTFQRVDSTRLPYPDASFDIVLTNHVIEHVGDAAAQLHHLCEVQRVLAPGGRAYLAVPNRWMLVEPHYKLAFLSWWPHAWRTPYLRFMRKGNVYDCEPLMRGELEALARAAGLEPRNASVAAFRATLAIEGDKGALARLIACLPDGWLSMLEGIIPTHIYVLRDATDASSA